MGGPVLVFAATKANDRLGSVYMVFEYLEHDLCGLMQHADTFSLAQVKCYMKQILQGLQYLHQRNIFHRDIKVSDLISPHPFQKKKNIYHSLKEMASFRSVCLHVPYEGVSTKAHNVSHSLLVVCGMGMDAFHNIVTPFANVGNTGLEYSRGQ